MNKIYMQKDEIPEDCSHCDFMVDRRCVASKEYEFDGYTMLICPRNGKSRGCPVRNIEEAHKKTAKKIIRLLRKEGKFQLLEQTIAVQTCINLIAKEYEVEVEE